jgi:hypothetical protein
VPAALAVLLTGAAAWGQPSPGYPAPGYSPPTYPPQPAPPPPGYPPQGYGTYPPGPAAQYVPPPTPESMQRRGLCIGFGIGGGNIRGERDNFGGFAVDFDVGLMLGPQLALMFDYSGVAHRLNRFDDTFKHDIYTGALQFFFMRFLWAKAGLGVGRLAVTDAYDQTLARAESTSAAVVLAGGAEVLQTTGGFALDLQLRLATATYQGDTFVNTSFLVGLNFY